MTEDRTSDVLTSTKDSDSSGVPEGSESGTAIAVNSGSMKEEQLNGDTESSVPVAARGRCIGRQRH